MVQLLLAIAIALASTSVSGFVYVPYSKKLAALKFRQSFTLLSALPPTTIKSAAALTSLAALGLTVKKLNQGRIPYTPTSVASEYDAWTQDGILEYYWGEHIHLGYYNKEEMVKGYKKKNFIQAKYDFTEEMMKFGGLDDALKAQESLKVLDVGCGVGGTSRFIAKQLSGKDSLVTGITLSPNQVARANELAVEQKVSNVEFKVMNALEMNFPDNSFDVVWGCESGEHMPSKVSERMSGNGYSHPLPLLS